MGDYPLCCRSLSRSSHSQPSRSQMFQVQKGLPWKSIMEALLVSLVAICFANVVSGVLVPEISDTPAQISTNMAQSGLTRADCDTEKLFELARLPNLDAKERKLLHNCRIAIELDIKEGVLKLDDITRLQVSVIAEEIINADGGQFIRGRSFYMPTFNRFFQEGILKALEQIYGDLSKLKNVDQFRKEYELIIIGTCKTLVDQVRQPVREYRVFTSSSDLFASEEPLRWSRYAEVCNQLIDSGFQPFGTGAYRLLANRLDNNKSAKSVLKKIIKRVPKKPRA